jgi:hypothetical protein
VTHSENQTIEIIPTLLVGDSSFDSNIIPQCTLCIEIDERRIRFCVVRDERMECVWLEDYTFDVALTQGETFEKLKRIFTGHVHWSSNHWRNVRMAINSHAFSLIPSLLFDEASTHDYLRFALGQTVGEGEHVLHHLLPLVNAYNVFCIPASWYSWILEHFASSSITFYHLTSPLIIGALVSHVEYQELDIVSVYLEKDYFTLIVTESQQLVFCNRFKFSQSQELAYIVLFTLKELNLLSEEVKVLCYGEISTTSDSYDELVRFFPNLDIGSGPTTLKYSRHCGDIAGHRYFGLFNTYLVSS